MGLFFVSSPRRACFRTYTGQGGGQPPRASVSAACQCPGSPVIRARPGAREELLWGIRFLSPAWWLLRLCGLQLESCLFPALGRVIHLLASSPCRLLPLFFNQLALCCKFAPIFGCLRFFFCWSWLIFQLHHDGRWAHCVSAVTPIGTAPAVRDGMA